MVWALGTAPDALIIYPDQPMLQISKMEIEELDHLSRAELRELWEREFAEKPPRCLGRDILALGIAYLPSPRRCPSWRKVVSFEKPRSRKASCCRVSPSSVLMTSARAKRLPRRVPWVR
jgi:hypothetical protein